MVHCGSVRQAAHVLHMTEMRSPGGTAIEHVHGVSLAPAVAAAAALLCPSATGAAHAHLVISLCGYRMAHQGLPLAAQICMCLQRSILCRCVQAEVASYPHWLISALQLQWGMYQWETLVTCVWVCCSGGAAAAAYQ